MIGWLWRVIVGRFSSCSHHWTVLHEIKVFDGGDRPFCRSYHLQCTACGDMKQREFQ